MISASKINTMRNFLLLFLSLITGCQAGSEVKGCTDGWVEFTCEYPETHNRYESISLCPPRQLIWSNKTDVWENKGRFYLYHDTKNKILNVTIRRLQHNDFGEYRCTFQGSKSSPDTVKLELENEKNECQEPFIQTAYKTAKTTISCPYEGKSKVKFFCRLNGSICEDIVSTRSLRSNGKFNLTESNRSLSMSISDVSSQHAGVYWCGVERDGRRNRAALRKITLKVEATITNFKRSPTIGQSLTYWCDYSKPKRQPDNRTKFICKGEDPSICEPLVTTEQTTGRFSMNDNRELRNISITVRDVRSEDTGTYWCGANTSDKTHSNPFFHRLVMTAVPPAAVPGVMIVIVSVAALLLLLLVLIVVLIYKRHSKNKRNAAAAAAAAQHNTEEYMYEELCVRPREPDSGHAMDNIYHTANFPTNPSASMHYSTINFHHCSGEAGGEALTTIPRSSMCEYSTVKYSHCPTDSTVNQPSSEDPLYSTINEPQEP